MSKKKKKDGMDLDSKIRDADMDKEVASGEDVRAVLQKGKQQHLPKRGSFLEPKLDSSTRDLTPDKEEPCGREVRNILGKGTQNVIPNHKHQPSPEAKKKLESLQREDSLDKEDHRHQGLRNILERETAKMLPKHRKNEGQTMSIKTSKTSPILIVEDNENNSEVIKVILESQGLDVKLVSSALEALEYCQKHTPTMVLMDIGLPDIDGVKLTELLLKMDTMRDVPFVAISAHTSDLMQKKAQQAGCSHFIEKPFVPGDLLEALASVKS